MKELKDKKENEMYKQLTGSPGLTSVSDAAKGEKPETLAEFEESYHDEWASKVDGKPHTVVSPEECHDIEEAYAMLFESLAMIARHK